MKQVTMIGLDLVKQIFQIRGVDAAGAVVLRRQIKHRQVGAVFHQAATAV